MADLVSPGAHGVATLLFVLHCLHDAGVNSCAFPALGT